MNSRLGLCIVLMGLIIGPEPASAQTAPDPARWQSSQEEQLSGDGSVLAYILKNGGGPAMDQLVIVDLQTRRERRLTCTADGRMAGLVVSRDGSRLAVGASSVGEDRGAICLFDLSSVDPTARPYADYFAARFLGDGRSLLLSAEGRAAIVDGDGELIRALNGEVTVDPTLRRLAVASPGEFSIYDIEADRLQPLDSSPEASYGGATWSPSGDAVAVVRNPRRPSQALVWARGLGSQSLRIATLSPRELEGFPERLYLGDLPEMTALPPFGGSALRWRSDETAIFVGLEAPTSPPLVVENFGPVIYRSDERFLPLESPPAADRKGVGLVHLDDGRFVRLSDPDEAILSVAGSGDHLLGLVWKDYDSPAYPMRSALNLQRADLVRIDLVTGERRSVVDGLVFAPWIAAVLSPSSEYFLFGDGDGLAVLTLADGTLRPVEPRIEGGFTGDASARETGLGYRPDARAHHWTTDGRMVLTDGPGDLWEIDLPTATGRRLTNGGGRYRYDVLPAGEEVAPDAPAGQVLDLAHGFPVVVTDLDTAATALGAWSAAEQSPAIGPWNDGRLDCLVHEAEPVACAVTFPGVARDLQAVNHLALGDFLTDLGAQRQGLPLPAGARYFTFRDASQRTQHATLILPAGFREGVRYPTVASNYFGASSSMIHQRIEPDVTGGLPGFAYRFSQAGYAVLLFDLFQEPDVAGANLIESATLAIQAATASGIVDPDRIGMRGHSYGGWETLFLASTTDLFRAAVSDGGMSDLVALSLSNFHQGAPQALSMLQGGGVPMSRPLWENRDAYLRNSPLWHARTMNTPLLMIHGDTDGNVPSAQSLGFFNALKLFGKPVTYLEYRGVDHFADLSNPPAYEDMVRREFEFFDYHLRDGPRPDWLDPRAD